MVMVNRKKNTFKFSQVLWDIGINIIGVCIGFFGFILTSLVFYKPAGGRLETFEQISAVFFGSIIVISILGILYTTYHIGNTEKIKQKRFIVITYIVWLLVFGLISYISSQLG